MVKKNNSSNTPVDDAGFDPAMFDVVIPENFTDANSDVTGTWTFKGTLHSVPLRAVLFDGKIDLQKPSCMIVARLKSPAIVLTEGEERVAQPGECVGLFYKPGMSGIRTCLNVECYVRLNGKTKDTGKPEPMKLFDVAVPPDAVRAPLPVEDYRVESADAKSPFDQTQGVKPTEANEAPDI